MCVGARFLALLYKLPEGEGGREVIFFHIFFKLCYFSSQTAVCIGFSSKDCRSAIT